MKKILLILFVLFSSFTYSKTLEEYLFTNINTYRACKGLSEVHYNAFISKKSLKEAERVRDNLLKGKSSTVHENTEGYLENFHSTAIRQQVLLLYSKNEKFKQWCLDVYGFNDNKDDNDFPDAHFPKTVSLGGGSFTITYDLTNNLVRSVGVYETASRTIELTNFRSYANIP